MRKLLKTSVGYAYILRIYFLGNNLIYLFWCQSGVNMLVIQNDCLSEEKLLRPQIVSKSVFLINSYLQYFKQVFFHYRF